MVRSIPNDSLPVSRWANGAGRKADLVTGEGWMAGFAWLDADAPFSDLAGFDRTITLVEGPGFTLDIAGRTPLEVHAPFQPAAFDGGAQTRCRIAGPSRVLNVMTRRGAFRHGVAIATLPFVGGAEAGGVVSLLVLLRGQAAVDGAGALGVLDAVQFDGPVQVRGGADGLLASITIGRA